MEKTLFRFIWKYSTRQQIIILLITFFSFPIVYLSLELPKQIVNDAIAGRDFPRIIMGVELSQVRYLLILSFSFLALVVLNNAVKYVLNIYKGLTGERMLRRLRYDLYQRVLRFRLPYFRNVSSGEIIPMITSEVEPVGGFIGDSIAVPAFYGGTLAVYIVFIFAQDPYLGIAAIALYPIQAYLIPKLQYRVNLLAKQRVQNVRRIADRVGESISGVAEIHANDTSAWHLADISDRQHT
ncbi:MAG: ABC transporter ATP-binding protein, partial [Hyphomicrobiales bacterium]|nr:ABC transporter ATP-binding protein [Hyphomicrobiales bacterium]